MSSVTESLPHPAIATAHPERAHFYLLPALVGFNFTFQTVLTILFFKSDPQQGTVTVLALNVLALVLAAFSSYGDVPSIQPSCFKTPTLRWAAAFLGFALVSITWTAGPLLPAGGYWLTWASGIATVWLLLRRPHPMQQAHSLMMGAIWGATLVTLVAWSLPTTSDLRIGDEDFLHPNFIGHLFALTSLLAMYLSRENKIWRWSAVWLAITLLRTLSKTSILAFIAAIVFYLVYDSALARKTKIWFGVIAAALLVSFWGLLETYLDNYAQGNSVETLTGRTYVWATTLNYALEEPWFGYGFYSYRSIIPLFGSFEPVHAHNELLHQFFSLGLVGVIGAFGVYWIFFRQIRRSPDGNLKTLAATLLVFALIRGLTDAEIYDLSLPIWLITMLSILLCSTCNQSEKLPGTSPRPVPQSPLPDTIVRERKEHRS
jgi:O-antigen ligase